MDNHSKDGRCKGIISILAAVVLLCVDQISKLWAANYLKNNGPIVIFKDWFELHYLENQGAAWGMLNGKVILLILFTLVMIVALIYMYCKIPEIKRYKLLKLSFLGIISGAIGNLIDRVLHHYVIDFFYFKKINFPIFNIADIYVTVGAAVFCILFLFVYKEDELTFWSFQKNHKKINEDGE